MRVLELCVCYNLEEANELCNATAWCYSVMVMCCSVASRMTMSDIFRSSTWPVVLVE